MTEAQLDLGQRLRAIRPAATVPAQEVAALRQRLQEVPVDGNCPDQHWSWAASVLALEAAAAGNYGVGALIIEAGAPEPLCVGANAMFSPRFDSSAHAEMRALQALEEAHAEAGAGLTLYTSLEPCPMCLARFIASRVSALKFVAWDEGGGMVSRLEHMPPVWRDIAAGRVIAPADCGEELRSIALAIFELRARRLDASLKSND
ncbi:MAG: nucleoside deaminase [Neomegalonema sp.]|nr:nucleoside deaminase [Neomegalonema sp.]